MIIVLCWFFYYQNCTVTTLNFLQCILVYSPAADMCSSFHLWLLWWGRTPRFHSHTFGITSWKMKSHWLFNCIQYIMHQFLWCSGIWWITWVSKVFCKLYVHWDKTCLNPSQDTEHELCCHNSAEKPIQKLIVKTVFTGERLFITEYFCIGDGLELCSCKNGHHGHQCLGTFNKVNIFGFDLTSIKYLGIYRVSQEECARLRESVPYVKLYRYNPKHLCPK